MVKLLLILALSFMYVSVGSQATTVDSTRPVTAIVKKTDQPQTLKVAKKYDSAVAARDKNLDALIEKKRAETRRADNNAKKAAEAERRLKKLQAENLILKQALLARTNYFTITPAYPDTMARIACPDIDVDSMPMPEVKKNFFQRVFSKLKRK